jgi:hypothetical protein
MILFPKGITIGTVLSVERVGLVIKTSGKTLAFAKARVAKLGKSWDTIQEHERNFYLMEAEGRFNDKNWISNRK